MRDRLEEWAGELATLELALEPVGPTPTNGRQSQAQPEGVSLCGPTLAQMTLLDPVATLITAFWQCQGALPSSCVAGAVAEAEADLFQIAVQVHGHNHGSQLVGKE